MLPLFTLPLQMENDVVIARQRARQVAVAVGLDGLDQIRVATAVSEIVRNAFGYAGGGRVAFSIIERADGQAMVVEVSDTGPGIPHLQEVLSGTYRSKTGLGLGLIGARRLLDDVAIDTKVGVGTTVRLVKQLPAGVKVRNDALSTIVDTIRRASPADAFSELREQNRELIEVGERLERQRQELRELNETLEERVEAAVAGRLSAEDRVRQSQKMEAIGQLTGGIAHDFNNMLAAVGSGVRLLEKRLASGESDVEIYLLGIKDALRRATSLTQRLLAFARPQPIAPEILLMNDVIVGMRDLLVRTLGSGILIDWKLEIDLGLAHLDSSELENALLNLCVNARDAMPDGGHLTIETRNEVNPEIKAGHASDYVCLSVTDTGSGMTAEVMEKAFHPFFTTKEVGKGTGLGLAQVFAFAKQSGGSIRIVSEPGRGTCVELSLPRR